MWAELLKRKTFYDLTGNGLNHPNDFGHCVYAETLLALLIDVPNDASVARRHTHAHNSTRCLFPAAKE